MRQVKGAHPDPLHVVPERGSSRRARGQTPRPLAASEGGAGFVRRTIGAFTALFTFRHPVFFLSFILTCFVFVFALLVSGVIGRTVRHTEQAIDAFAVRAGFGIVAVNVSGNVRTPRAAILAQAGLGPYLSAFSVSPLETRFRLMQLAWVKDADVRRRFPGEIDVTVTERQPFALWQPHAGDPAILIERGGERIAERDVTRFKALPLVVGVGAPEMAGDFVEAVRRHPTVAAKVKAYTFRSERRWDLVLVNGVVVKLPEYGWKKQLDDLDRLIARRGVLDYDTGEIDLRSSSYFIFGQVPSVKPDEKKPEEGRAI